MRTELVIIGLLSISHAVLAQTAESINLMPMPASVQLGSGQLPIDQSFSVAISGHRDAVVDKGVQRFSAQLSRQTGMLLAAASGKNNPTLSVKVEGSVGERVGEDESYHLRVTSSGGSLSAPNPLG